MTVRQAAALYVYENTLYTVEMTGAQLKDALEHSASFLPAWPFPADKHGCASRVQRRFRDGRRVRRSISRARWAIASAESEFSQARRSIPRRNLRVAINNYRYTGGGGYSVYKGLPILARPREIRELLIEYMTRTGRIPAEADGNWKIEPAEAVAAMEKQAAAETVDRTR